jgi:Carbohydrate-selective porin, OprB family/S-layer homology domain
MTYFKETCSFTLIAFNVNLLILSPVLAQAIPNKNTHDRESVAEMNKISNAFVSKKHELPLVSSKSEPQFAEINATPARKVLNAQRSSNETFKIAQVLNVNDLEDVSPTHWAYEALRSLVEKYQCISGSSDNLFNGNRAITRYEFAGALNSCLLKLDRSINSANAQLPSQEDLAVIQRLQSEFDAELQDLNVRISDLEQQVDILQNQQFSTTTVLRGRVDFSSISAFGDKKATSPGNNLSEELDSIDSNFTFSSRAILILDTSFTGKDRLQTTIVSGNANGFGSSVTGTNMTGLVGAINTANDLRLSTLFYQFPIGDRGTVAIAPAADFPTRIFPALNPVFSISNFGAESPIYSFAFGSGAVAYYQFTDEIAAGVSYLSLSGSDVTQGLFGGQYTALTQLTYTPSDELGIAFTYGKYYTPEPVATINTTGGKGSQFAQYPFGESTATSSDAFGLQLTYKLSDHLILGSWASYFNARAEGSPSVSNVNGSSGDRADIWSWALTASLSDLGKLGSQFSFVFGMPPKVTSNDTTDRQDPDTSLHFELSYRYPLTERIFLTPGFLMITNPEHNTENDTVWIGLLRTSFSF